jgi:hypothetical protein
MRTFLALGTLLALATLVPPASAGCGDDVLCGTADEVGGALSALPDDTGQVLWLGEGAAVQVLGWGTGQGTQAALNLVAQVPLLVPH